MNFFRVNRVAPA